MAATRYYPTIRPPGSNLFGPPLGNWDPLTFLRANRGSRGHWTWLLDQSKTKGGQIDSITPLSNGNGAAVENIWSGIRWVTPKLASQTLGGSLQITFGVFLGGFFSGVWNIHAYLTNGDSLTQRTVLLNNFVDTNPLPNLGVGFKFTNLTLTATLPAAVVTAGDRIVVEIGARVTGATIGVGAFALSYGTTNNVDVPGADAVNGDTDQTKVGWLEFSAGVVELGGDHPEPANDTCATAKVILPSSLPYTDGPYDTIGSTDADKAVWYEFTPNETGLYFGTDFGSNIAVLISVFTGGCGALVLESDGAMGRNRGLWLGTGQTAQYWLLTAGVPYKIRVTTDASFIPTQAKQSGGSLVFNLVKQRAPQTNDLYVNCQHLVALRDGVVVNINSSYYGSTPVGSAIDYTRRPLLNQFNGSTSTGIRLYVGLYGDTTLIEIFDLATLDLDGIAFTDEIDFFFDSFFIDPSTRSKFENSIVFDKAGLMYTGYLGDADNVGIPGQTNSVQGGIGSANSVAMRRIDATHADDQPGNPFPAPDRFDMAQDVGGSWFVEMASDQRTVFYTSSGTKVKRFDVVANAQLADFATTVSVGPRPGLRSIRLLPPGDGTGGAIVANGSNVLRLDATGATIQTYSPTPASDAQDLDKVEFNDDATEFYVSDQYSTNIWRFDVETGAQVSRYQPNLPPGQLCGFSVFNGYRAGISNLTPPPQPIPCISLSDGLSALAARLEDPTFIHWTQAELTRYLIEAIRTYSAFTQYYRNRGSFQTIQNVPFYELPDVLPLLRGYNVTDAQLVTDIEYALMEPPTPAVWTGSEQFTLADVVRCLEEARDQFLRETGAVVTRTSLPVSPVPTDGRVMFSDQILTLRRLAWADATGPVIPLHREDEWALSNFTRKWPQNPVQPTGIWPTGYSVGVTPPTLVQIAPVPTADGALDLLSINAGTPLDPTAPILVGIPDDWTWVIKYKALGDLLSQFSVAFDPPRAAYCVARWQQGVAMAAKASVVLAGRIDNVISRLFSVSEADLYKRQWQSAGVVPTQILTDGQNIVGVCGMPNGAYTVTLDVVSNVPIPEVGTDCLPITQAIFEPILDLAEHLALFKEGAGQLNAAMDLYNRFTRSCGITVELDVAQVPQKGPIFDQTKQDERSESRRVPPDSDRGGN